MSVNLCELGGDENKEIDDSCNSAAYTDDDPQPLVQPALNGLRLSLVVENENTLNEAMRIGAEDPDASNQMTTRNYEITVNREILENLCNVSPVEYVAKFRLVCKEWNQAAQKAWRMGAKLTVVEYQKENPRKEIFRKMLNLPDLTNYVEDPDDPLTLDSTKNYHYQKYKLESWYMTNSNPNMRKFWNYFGSFIRHLQLSNLRIERMDTIRSILYDMLPNMQTLVLEKLYVLKPEALLHNPEQLTTIRSQSKLKIFKVKNLMLFQIDWAEFFRHFPNIESLETVNFRNDHQLQLILSSILSMQEKLQLKSLTIIRGDGRHKCVQRELMPVTLSNLETCVAEMSVEECSLKLGCKTTVRIADYLLKIFSDRIRKLTFHIDFKCNVFANKFPYYRDYPNLEELELYQWCQPIIKLDMIFKCMPKLKILKVKGLGSLLPKPIENEMLISFDEEKFNPCRSLEELSSTVYNLTLIKFKMLTALVPNLTKLELKMDNNIFALICMKYENLVELRVCGTGLTDEGITGFPKNYQNKPGPSRFRRYANISYLKKLRVFVMRDQGHPLTSKSVFDGFLKVNSLFTLQISLPSTQISLEARRALERSIPNLIVTKELKNNNPGTIKVRKNKKKKM